MLLNEMIHEVRIVPLDGRLPLPRTIHQWRGDSRGHWDGDTLVVETTSFLRPDELRRNRFRATPTHPAARREHASH